MSYLAEPTSTGDYGIVKVGDYIQVTEGVISLSQDLSPGASVTFSSVSADLVFSDSEPVVTSVTPTAGDGISILSLVDGGPDVSFTVSNTGVLSLTAGPGITIDQSTGDIVISSVGADFISVYGTTVDYTASLDDEYIGVSSTSPVVITLPFGIFNGRIFTIKNEYGNNSGTITLQPALGELIDGKPNYVMRSPYQSVNIVFRAGNWWII
jgi:hypothetical protein